MLPTPPPSALPKNFVWGVAASAPQIEGAAFLDGKGESIWDRFCRIPGRIVGGDTLDVACDHYHRFEEDFALMQDLGIRHYRLSLAWPRILPAGAGAVNQAGVDFYNRLLDAMLARGITPWVTLFHWDLPQALEDQGGWRSRKTVDAFARYADLAVRTWGSRVKHWFTLNEIRCFTALAYGPGAFKAPGQVEPAAVVNQTYHHALLCHGHGVRAVREHGGAGAQVGMADNSDTAVPVTETPADIAAAGAWFREQNLHILDPIYRRAYAPEYLARCGADAPQVAAGDFDLIGLPTDFLGLNVYSGVFVRAGADGRPEVVAAPTHYPAADSAWLRWLPSALYWTPRFVHETYGATRLYITENGCGYDDEPVVGGEVRDLHRREFLRVYLRELERAVAHGVPVHGYFLWSFLDNYEWEDGYRRRFGLVHVDFATQRRTPKLSARWYAQVIKAGRVL